MKFKKVALLIFSSLLLVGCGPSNSSTSEQPSSSSSSSSEGPVLATEITIQTDDRVSYLQVGDKINFYVTYNVPGCLEGVTWTVSNTRQASITYNTGVLTCLASTFTDLAVMATYNHNNAVYATYYIKIHDAPPERIVNSIDIVFNKDTFKVSERLDDLKENFTYVLNWSNGDIQNITKSDLDTYGLTSLYSPLDGYVDISDKFNCAGTWKAEYLMKYKGDRFTTEFSLPVESGLRAGLTPNSISVIHAPFAYHGTLFNPTNVLSFKVGYTDFSKG